MGNVVFSIIWLVILIFIGFWIAGLAAGLYIIIIPFTVCIEPLSSMVNVLYSLIWLLILFVLGFWIASVASTFYIFLVPFSVCIEPLSPITDTLLKVIQFPKYCAEGFVQGKGFP